MRVSVFIDGNKVADLIPFDHQTSGDLSDNLLRNGYRVAATTRNGSMALTNDNGCLFLICEVPNAA